MRSVQELLGGGARASLLALTLVSLALDPTAASGASDPARAPNSSESEETRPLVFPAGRASADARLHRKARTTDTPVEWKAPYDPVTWLERARELKTRAELAGGIWRYPGAVMIDHVHAVADRDDYTVENVLFQSYFNQFIPGNLYRSKVGPENKPVILLPHDHREGGRLMERTDEEARRLVESGEERSFEAAKYPLQARCAQLARMGCNVLVYDMVGHGELRGWDHQNCFSSVEDVLRLQNLYAFQLWNSFMALNYIWNMDGVDKQKVGMAGVGGGGSQTLYFSAIEPRVKASFVACALSNTFQGGCRCENPSYLRVGTSNIELAAAIAPRALALTGANDWSSDVEVDVLPELRKVWDLVGDADDVIAKAWPEFGPGFHVHAREMLYDFFNEKLELGIDGPILELPFEPLTPRELRVFDAMYPDPPRTAKSPREVFANLTTVIDAQLDLLFIEESPHRLGVFRGGMMYQALRMMMDTHLPAAGEVDSRLHGTRRGEGRSTLELSLGRKDSGEEVPALLVMPDEWNGTVLIGVAHDGKQHFFGGGNSAFADAARVVEQGVAFLAPDVLLTGEYLNPGADGEPPRLPVDDARHDRYVGYTYCYNRPLIAERVHDILTTIAYARSLEGVRTVNLVGTGEAGPWVIMARALIGTRERVGDEIFRTAAQWSWDFDQISSFKDPNFLPGALRYGGVPYFAALIAPAELRLTVAPRENFPMLVPEVVMKAYRSINQVGNVRSEANDKHAALIDWLAGTSQ